MSDLEQTFIQATKRLYEATQQYAQLKLQMIHDYMEKHHPGVTFEVKSEEDNLLAVDLVFPGAGRTRSYELACEVNNYLQGLLARKNEVINER